LRQHLKRFGIRRHSPVLIDLATDVDLVIDWALRQLSFHPQLLARA
jgi:hypothetical protein